MNNFLNCINTVFSNELLSLVLLLFLIYATYTDVKYLKIYNKFNIFIMLVRVAFIFIPVYTLELTAGNIVASLSAFMIFLTIAMIFMHKMGGDIKFIGAFMLYFNFEYMLVFSAIASVLNGIYCIFLKLYFNYKKKKINSNEYNYSLKEKILMIFIKISLLRKPSDKEIESMNYTDINKYKLPFAPFFLMSYIITYIIYLT